MTVHTIFVPKGWSIEQTWEAIKRGHKYAEDDDAGVWVNVDDEGRLIVPQESSDGSL